MSDEINRELLDTLIAATKTLKGVYIGGRHIYKSPLVKRCEEVIKKCQSQKSDG
jgi:hypothetical protein